MPTEPNPRDYASQSAYVRALKAAGIKRRETRARLDWKLANGRDPTLNELQQNSKYVAKKHPNTPINVSYPASLRVINQKGKQQEVIYQEETVVTTKIRFGTLPKGELKPFLKQDYERRKDNVIRSLAQSRGIAGRHLAKLGAITSGSSNLGRVKGFSGYDVPKSAYTVPTSNRTNRGSGDYDSDSYQYGLS